jgi:hypothetical protein
MGEEPNTTMWNIPLHTPMYTAQYIRQNFVKSNELDNIVGGIVPKNELDGASLRDIIRFSR